MSRQSLRLIAMAASLCVCIAAGATDNVALAAITAFAAGMWFSAFMRRVAIQHGINLEDET